MWTNRQGAARSPRRSGEQGFALLIVLWIFIVLFAVGAEFSGAMRQGAAATMNFAGETQSYYLAVAVANRTFYKALTARDEALLEIDPMDVDENGEPKKPLIRVDGQWHSELLWGAPVWIRIIDESGKVPLNLVNEPILRYLLRNFGLGPEDADATAAAILDWRDKDDEERVNGAESDHYLSLSRPYPAKNSVFDSLEELLLIRGVSWDLFHGGTEEFPVGLKEVFTVFSSEPALNIRSASRNTLRILLGLDDEQAEEFEELRRTAPGGIFGLIETMVTEPALLDLLTDEPPNLLSVEVQARLPDSPVAAHVGAVIDLAESHEGYYIVRWFDQLPAARVPAAPAVFPEAA